MKKAYSTKIRSQGTRKQSAAKKAPRKTPKPLKSKWKASAHSGAKRARLKKSPRQKIATVKLPAPRRPTPEEVALKNALEQFANAVKLFSSNEFSKARGILGRLVTTPAADLAERARAYLNICNQRLSRSTLHLKTADDFYNHGVQLANQRNLEEAEECLKKALTLAPKCDYIYYAMATTEALRGNNVEGALEHLQKAIELNAQNRYLAQKDPDFSNLEEDPRFTEMIYPEKSPA